MRLCSTGNHTKAISVTWRNRTEGQLKVNGSRVQVVFMNFTVYARSLRVTI